MQAPPIQAGGILAAALLALLTGCGGGVLSAAGQVGSASRASAEAFAPTFAMAADVCRRRAELDFLEHRLEGSDAWGTGTGWSKWYETRITSDTLRTWKEHCERIQQSDKVLLAAIRALAAYGDALHTFATGTGINGDDVKAACTGGTGIAGNLSKDTATKDRYSAAGSALGELLAALANVISEKITAGETRSIVVRSDRLVQAMLRGMEEYASATEEQLTDEAQRLAGVLRAVEVKMKNEAALGPLPALQFVDFARRNERAIRADRSTLVALHETLHTLAEAHGDLTRGAVSKDSATLDSASHLAVEATRRANAGGRIIVYEGGDR